MEEFEIHYVKFRKTLFKLDVRCLIKCFCFVY